MSLAIGEHTSFNPLPKFPIRKLPHTSGLSSSPQSYTASWTHNNHYLHVPLPHSANHRLSNYLVSVLQTLRCRHQFSHSPRLLRILASNPYVSLISLDFSQAFDTNWQCPTSHPLPKLASLNTLDGIYNWRVAFLNGRCRRSHVTRSAGWTSSSALSML